MNMYLCICVSHNVKFLGCIPNGMQTGYGFGCFTERYIPNGMFFCIRFLTIHDTRNRRQSVRIASLGSKLHSSVAKHANGNSLFMPQSPLQ